VPLGKADVKRTGSDITVVAISKSVVLALDAAQVLEGEGISVEVIDPMTIKPLDEDTIVDSVKKTGRLLVVHEAHRTGGFGAEVAAVVADKAIDHLDAPIKRVAALDSPVPFGLSLEAFVLPTADDIVKAARNLAR
jgi:pyruvate dehydrogenase E1 component beta subunit